MIFNKEVVSCIIYNRLYPEPFLTVICKIYDSVSCASASLFIKWIGLV